MYVQTNCILYMRVDVLTRVTFITNCLLFTIQLASRLPTKQDKMEIDAQFARELGAALGKKQPAKLIPALPRYPRECLSLETWYVSSNCFFFPHLKIVYSDIYLWVLVLR